MNTDECIRMLASSDIKSWIEQNLNVKQMLINIYKQFGISLTPNTTAIVRYIEDNLHFRFNTNLNKWVPYYKGTHKTNTNELDNVLKNTELKALIKSGCYAYEIENFAFRNLGEYKCPNIDEIISYIENNFNFIWDAYNEEWISSRKHDNTGNNSNKKGTHKVETSLTTFHETEIPSEDIPQDSDKDPKTNKKNDSLSQDENSTPIGTQIGLSLTTNNEENIHTINFTSGTEPPAEKITTPKLSKDNNFIDENIDPSEYPKFILIFGSTKFSVSLSNFILELTEQRITKNFGIKRNRNRSKIIELALVEYLRLTKDTGNVHITNNTSKTKVSPPKTTEPKLSDDGNFTGIIDENIDPSEYPKFILIFGSTKFTISISIFVIGLIEQRIAKNFNIKHQKNRSKIIEIALTEYLRLTK